MNRVNQIYNDDLAVRMVLIDDTDKLNLDTDAKATGANGPCGSAPCFTPPSCSCAGACSTATGSRSASSSAPQARRRSPRARGHGGGVAGLGVIGGDGKARGYRPPDARGRLLRRRLRGARDRPPVRWHPHVQRHGVQLLAATAAARRTSRARAARSWPTPASASRTTSSRTATRTSPSAASPTSATPSPPPARRSTTSRRSRSCYDTAGDAFTLTFRCTRTAPIVRGTDSPRRHRRRARGPHRRSAPTVWPSAATTNQNNARGSDQRPSRSPSTGAHPDLHGADRGCRPPADVGDAVRG